MCGVLPARAITFTPAGCDFIRGGLLFPNPRPFSSVDIAIFGISIFPTPQTRRKTEGQNERGKQQQRRTMLSAI